MPLTPETRTASARLLRADCAPHAGALNQFRLAASSSIREALPPSPREQMFPLNESLAYLYDSRGARTAALEGV